jgi:hypothetical protein
MGEEVCPKPNLTEYGYTINDSWKLDIYPGIEKGHIAGTYFI